MKDFLQRLYSEQRADARFEEMRAFAKENGVPIMLEDTERLLKALVRIKQPAHILEIGTAIGYSGSLMLLCSPQSRLFSVEMDEQMIALAEQNFKKNGVYDRVTLFKGDAKDIVGQITGSFDFVFLDGPKRHYAEFFPYLKELLASGGVLVSDNVLFHGYVENMPVRRHRAYGLAQKLNEFLHDLFADDDFESVLLEIGDGVSVSVKK